MRNALLYFMPETLENIQNLHTVSYLFSPLFLHLNVMQKFKILILGSYDVYSLYLVTIGYVLFSKIKAIYVANFVYDDFFPDLKYDQR